VVSEALLANARREKIVNTYCVYHALNWPAALFDRNDERNWPSDYRFAGEFRADSLDELWAWLNRDDRPNARVDRSMCVGDVVIIAEAGETSGEARGQMWIARRVGWEELHPAAISPDFSNGSNVAFLRRCALEGEAIDNAIE
jgi:hypothetical protein